MKGYYILLNKKPEQVRQLRKCVGENHILSAFHISKDKNLEMLNEKVKKIDCDYIVLLNIFEDGFSEKLKDVNKKKIYVNNLQKPNFIIIPKEQWIEIPRGYRFLKGVLSLYNKDKIHSMKTFIQNGYKYTINFYGRNKKDLNRGPVIQNWNKVHYFKKYISNTLFFFDRKKKDADWEHFLFPFESNGVKNSSIGPNIHLNGDLEEAHKKKRIVADSHYMKEYLIYNFGVNPNLISVIPVFIREYFYNTQPKPRKKFTVGLVGYYENRDIKNFSSIPQIAKRFPNIDFQILSSRPKSRFPKWLRDLPNLTWVKCNNDRVPETMKQWHLYLGLSKRERGPAALQESKCIGIPSLTPDHTGYSEFCPTLMVPVQPYKEHSQDDIDLFCAGIEEIRKNWNKYSGIVREEKERFWKEEKNPKKIAKLWQDFFSKCIKEK